MENQEEGRVSRMRGRHMAKGRGGAARHHDMRDDSVPSEPRQIVDRPQQVSEQPVEVISPEGVLNLKALKRAKVTELAQVARDFEVEGAVNMRKAGDDLRGPPGPGASQRRHPRRGRAGRSCPTASASCALPITTICPAPTTSISHRARFVSSIFAREIRFRIDSAAQGGRALLRAGFKVESINYEDPEKARDDKILFDNLTPLYPTRTPQARIQSRRPHHPRNRPDRADRKRPARVSSWRAPFYRQRP